MPATQSKRTVLIVEDENIVAEDLRFRLRELGFVVLGIAASGKDAVVKAIQVRPDVVLTDIVLKGRMDGIEASTQIRKNLDFPVIFVTAFSDKTFARLKDAEKFRYILKPFENEELAEAIQNALHL